jgi:hypothetical protein
MIKKLLFNLGKGDCRRGNPARLKFKAYLSGYGYQYELEQKSNYYEESN